MTICKHCQVNGRVQGVSYRYATRKKALELAVSGYVRNLENGSVEVLACGDEDSVASLCQWLMKGPVLAQVSSVQCQDYEAITVSDFSIV